MDKKIAIFVDHPRCSVDCINSVMTALQPYYRFKIFTRHAVPNDDWFDDVAMLLVPGGTGDVEGFHRSMKLHIPWIRDFILNEGGRYLGICMGAYWASKSYLNILSGLECVQFMGRPGSNTFRPHPKDLEVDWLGKNEKMYWYDGCSIVGHGKFEVVARYKNGDVMAGYQDRVGLIGSHPEAEKYWYESHSWMKKHYDEEKNKRNNKLLLEFVDVLMNK